MSYGDDDRFADGSAGDPGFGQIRHEMKHHAGLDRGVVVSVQAEKMAFAKIIEAEPDRIAGAQTKRFAPAGALDRLATGSIDRAVAVAINALPDGDVHRQCEYDGVEEECDDAMRQGDTPHLGA